jgi:PAS domain S-box-containing protein
MNKTQFDTVTEWQTHQSGMVDLYQEFDWTSTALGHRTDWSASLELALEIVLASAFPMALRWGREFTLLYNDAYRPILGDKHPWALGRPARDAWSEVWPQIEPVHMAILEARAPSVFAEDVLMNIQRNGSQWEDARFTLGYSPIKDPTSPTGVGGVFVTAIETTERFTAERALKSSEERYALALAAATAIGTWDWDIVNDIVVSDAVFAEQYSIAADRAKAGVPLATFVDGIHPDDRERVAAAINASIAQHRDYESEYRVQKSDGSISWVFARGRCHYDETGKPIRFPGATVDITDRKTAEAELARSEAEFRTFSQAVPNHVWASPPDGRLNWFNDRVYEYSGQEPGTLDGDNWVAMVHPNDQQAASESWAASIASGGTYQTEFRLKRADGSYRWHLARALPIRDDVGRIIRWIGTNTDIQDQKASSAALKRLNATLEERVARQAAERDRLWQTSQDLLVVVNRRGIFTAANPAWTSVLGWQPEEVVGQSHLRFVHPDDQPAGRDILKQALDGPIRAFENRCVHKDGGVRWISWVASWDDGLIYATGRNITAEKAAAAELASTQEALRQSQKMEAVGQLTGGIAHDFNNMLSVVMGSLELLGRRLSEDDERSHRYVGAATEGARRAALLTQRLLAFSRQQPLQPEAVDPNKLVAGMSDLLRHSLGTDVRLETVLAGGLWRTHADPNQLENIIVNLAINARDAMPDGGRLTIETQNAHLDERYTSTIAGLKSGQYVLIAVTDTGSGMAPDVLEKAFEPFFTTKAVGKGTGLGLSQVYGFVRQSGGHVRIYTEIGQGTTIKIYLPRLVDSNDTADIKSDLKPLARGEIGEVVLVVEDEPAVRAFSVEALTELGYQVLEADGASAALRLIDAHPEIMLLFSDVVMPEMNGARLAEEARRRRPDLKILFTTGYTRDAIVHNGVLDPGVALIGKPYTLEALATKLRAVIEKP